MKRFSIAAHTYFKVKNHSDQKHDFIAGDIENPRFVYEEISKYTLRERIDIVTSDRARKNLELVLAALELRAQPTSKYLQKYRNANTALYSLPKSADLSYLFQKAEMNVTAKTASLWQYIEKELGSYPESDEYIEPSKELFYTLKGYLKQYTATHDIEAETLYDSFEKALLATGLQASGWRVKLVDGSCHARVFHAKKTILVGKDYKPRTHQSLLQIVFHEVYGHALRNMSDDNLESEGFATLLEQLIIGKFTTMRSYRYIAAALGWGMFGRPRTFREVYEIIWRLMAVRGRYNENTAKTHAYDECVRVFRGGIPSMPGAVYLKDTVYFRGNIEIWRILMKKPPSYNEFVDILEGRKKIL